MTLRALADDIWVADHPLRFCGCEIGSRMTVVRLTGGRLFLHSPVRHSAELQREVEALGPPAFIVAPNRMHHLAVGDWCHAFPAAQLYVAPGLDEKRPDLVGARVLEDDAPEEWREEIDQIAVAGFPIANEVDFFHRASGTLILTDIAFNFGDDSPPLTRTMFRFIGRLNQLAPSAAEKLLIRDRPAFAADLRRILEWPFDRVVVTHGDVVETGGREQLIDGYRWLLG